jgi:hypothetical protein
MKRLVIFVLISLASITQTSAQCAMCRATLENNISNGNIGIAAGINFGILYLFFAPYLAISVIAILWYKTSRRNAPKDFTKRGLAG